MITRVLTNKVIGFVRWGDRIDPEAINDMETALLASDKVAAYSSTDTEIAPVWSFGKCLRMSGFIKGFVLYKVAVWREVEWLAADYPGCSEYVLKATAAMQGDFLAMPGAVLVRGKAPYPYYGEGEAQKELFSIAESCRTCRARLRLPPLPGDSGPVNTAPRIAKCCGQL